MTPSITGLRAATNPPLLQISDLHILVMTFSAVVRCGLPVKMKMPSIEVKIVIGYEKRALCEQ